MKKLLPAVIFLSVLLAINSVFAQAPVLTAKPTIAGTAVTTLAAPKITYTTPQTFTAGTAITPLTPVNTGGAVPATVYAQVSAFAGSGAQGSANGTGTAASFNSPQGMAIDASGNIYVADVNNNIIRKISSTGTVTTFAGSGAPGFVNGTGTGASFNGPIGLAVDASGNVYVADLYNQSIRKITSAGVVTTLAGSGSTGSTNGTGTAASFSYPRCLATDAAGNVYVTDQSNNLIRKITPAGVVTTFAGNGAQASINGTGTAASFDFPFGIAIDPSGNFYVSDYLDHLIRKITSAGVVTTFAGSGVQGSANGTGTAASFNNPSGLTTDPAGNVYVADFTNNIIRKITPAGVVTTLAGSGSTGFANGAGTAASFSGPLGVVADTKGYVYVADAFNNLIRKIYYTGYGVSPTLPKGLAISTAGVISGTPTTGRPAAVYSVTATNTSGTGSFNINIAVTGPPIISYPTAITFVTGKAINELTPVSTGGIIPTGGYGATTTFAGTVTAGSANGTGIAATFNHPYGAVTDGSGNIYIADQSNNLIRKITTAGVVTTFAGSGAAGAVNGTGTAASFNKPSGLAADPSGNIYVADFGNGLIRKITSAGVVSTVAGAFKSPVDVAIDAAGNIYSADKVDNIIQKLIPAGSVTTFASGFTTPDGIALDAAGDLYVADATNRISKISSAGTVTVFAGSGTAGYTNGTGTAAAFNNPGGLKVDAAGNIYVADLGNNVVRKITPVGLVTTLAGTGTAGALNGTGITATFNGPSGLAVDASNNLYVADAGNNLIRKVIDIGFGIVPTLPTGLSMTGNGVILGIPTKATPVKAYTITAYNVSGKGSSTITITVTGPPIITYATPQTYTTSVGITPLAPTNTGGAVPVLSFGSVTTFAGTTSAGSFNGTGTGAAFNGPLGVATDGSGNIYVADQQNNLIRKITPAGVVITLAGSGAQGAANGTGTAASFNHPTGLAVDQLGNVFVADQNNNLIRKITPAGVVTTFAGSGSAGFVNGTGTAASFYLPTVVALDASNNLYVTDLLNNAIRKITSAGVVTTFAGSGTAGSANGTGTAASFHYPTGIAVDGSGTVYVADQLNHEIRRITYLGVVTTLAGNGTAGSANGTGAAATFNDPYAVTVDGSGNVYVADYNNNEIRLVTSLGVVTTVAGSTAAGSANGTGNTAGFNHPASVSLDGNGNLYVADYYNNEIRNVNVTGFTITPALPAGLGLNSNTGVISGTPITVSALTTYSIKAYNGGGSGTAALKIAVTQGLLAPAISYAGPDSYTEGTAIATLAPKNTGGAVPASVYGQVSAFAGSSSGTPGSADGTGAAASFNTPFGDAVDAAGNVYIADAYKGLVRKITPAGVVTTLAGSGVNGAVNGTGTAASFYYPKGIALDAAGNIYVADSQNNLIRKITPAGVVTTFAGSGAIGSANGVGVAASFNFPSGIAVDDAGNIYVADSGNNLIRQITPSGTVTTLAGNGSAGAANGPALASSFNSPTGIAITPTGIIYVADSQNNLVRAISGGLVSTFAGSGSQGAANGTGTLASFSSPEGVAVDRALNVYVTENADIRKISPSGVVTVLADSELANVTGSFGQVFGVAINGSGLLYITDSSNNIVMKVSLTGYGISAALPPGLNFGATTGVISGKPTAVVGPTTYTVTAGNSSGSATADVTIGVVNSVNPATVPNIYTVGRVNDPYGTARDASGNLYVASTNDNVVYRVDAVTQAVTVIAGTGIDGYSGDGGPATSAQLSLGLSGLAVDGAGNVYIGDSNNNRVRKVDATTHVITTIAGTGVDGNSGTGGLATAAQLSGPGGILIDASNNIYISDENNEQIVKVDATTKKISTVLTGLGFVERMVFDKNGVLYFGDEGTNTIEKYNIATSTLSIIGGNGTFGNSGDGGPATSAQFEDPMSVAVDASGNVYIADQPTYTIRKIDATTQKISTYAGTGTDGYTGDGASAILAEMGFLTDLVIDNNGYLYIGDNGNGVIRKIGGTLPSGSAPHIAYTSPQAYTAGTAIAALSPSNSGGAVPAQSYATVTTFAGSGNVGELNGTGTAASFSNPQGCATDALGNVYVADQNGNAIRKITPSGIVTTFAGSGTAGKADGTGTAASFSGPSGLAIDGSGNIYVADTRNNEIRKITPSGEVTTLAGNGSSGFVNGTGAAATFSNPQGVAVDLNGYIYVSDTNNGLIRKIDYSGAVTTFAGSGAYGFANGTGTAASFAQPIGITADAAGNLYVADQGNFMIRKITPAGVVTIYAGRLDLNGDGRGDQTIFPQPTGVTIDNFGTLYVTDYDLLKRVTADGTITIIAGGAYGPADGIGTAATFGYMYGLSADAFNNLYIAEQGSQLVRKVSLLGYGITPGLPAGLTFNGTTGAISGTPTMVGAAAAYSVIAENESGYNIANLSIGVDNPVATQAPAISYTGPQTYVAGTAISTLTPTNTGGAVPDAIYAQVSTLAGTGTSGVVNGTGTAAGFGSTMGLATDASGNVYLADGVANQIWKITPAGVVTSLAGSSSAGFTNGTGAAAKFNNPFSVAVDASGNVYVADSKNNAIRKITPAGVVTTLAGSGTVGSANGTGTAASFNSPHGVAVDASGNVYIADLLNNLIRKITPAGIVTTLAGSGTAGSANGTGTAASFSNPQGVAVDASGNVYVADLGNNLIRKITSAGVVTTLAGSGAAGSKNGTGTAASFAGPQSVTVDKAGNVYVSDSANNLIREISPAGAVTTLAGGLNGPTNTGVDVNATGTSASFNFPQGIALDKDGNLYVSDLDSPDIRKINLTGYNVIPALSKGLAFDGTTGIISGTPGAITLATTYSISAYNTAGSSTANLIITVNAAAVAAPVIVYAGPKTYPVNTAIAPLTPTNTGGAVPASASVAVSTFAGSGAIGALNGKGTAATFNLSQGNLAIDKNGNIYVADDRNYLVRKITPAGVVTTLAGSGVSQTVDGTGTAASFSSIQGITADPSGNVYVTDFNLVRKITPAGVVTTFAGGGPTINGSSVDGTGTAASFFSTLFGLASDSAGNVYVAEPNDGKIRKITPAGVVSTIIANESSDALRLVFGLTVDASGNIYGACSYANVIIKVTQAGVMTTVAGTLYLTGSQNGAASSSTFYYPYGITIDPSGNLFVADYGDYLIREISTSNIVSTYAGNTLGGLGNSTPAASYFYLPENLAIDAAGNKYIYDAGNDMVRKIGTTGYTIAPALPAGLTMNPNTGVISGTPTAVSAATTYTITAYDSGGTATATVSIAVTSAGLNHIAAKTYGAPDFSLGKTSTSPIPVSSSNTAVATIVGGKIHITGAGTSEISMVASGATVSQTLTVKPAPLTIVTNDQFKKAGSEIPRLTLNYTGFVNGETEDALTVKPTISTDARPESGAGEYAITVAGAVAPNYEITYATGKLIITAADGQVTKTGIADTNDQPGLELVNGPEVKQAVSPNGDGVNDVLQIDNIANYPDNKLELISRDGVKIFEAEHYDNVNHPFDGHSNINGRMQLPGTYFYLLEYKVKGELKRKTGFFILKY